MTGRRQHHDGREDPRDQEPGERRDAWEAFGAADGAAEDFWGDSPDWSGTASTSRRSGRRRIGGAADEPFDPTPIGTARPASGRGGLVGSIRGAWDGLLGGGADSTREHRRVDVAAAASPVDDTPTGVGLDDWGDDWVEEWNDSVPPVRHDASGPDHRAAAAIPADAGEADEPVLERHWIAGTSIAAESRSGIDPLLARLGAVVIVACLLVPMLIAVLGSNDLTDRAAGAIASQPAVAADVNAAPATPATPDGAATSSTDAPLDPSSLPPAVPVNTEPPSTADASDGAANAASASTVEVAASTQTASTATAASDDSATAASESVDSISEVDEPASAGGTAARVDPPVCPVPYTVVSGDYWLRLVDAANVELAELLAANGATVDTPLYPGSEICLPAGATTPAPPATTTTTEPPTTTTAPPTTAPPTTTAPTTTPTTQAPSEPPGPEEIKQIVRDVWPDDLEDRALEIVYRESRFVPTAKNFCCYGLFQIYWEVHDVWLDDLGITSANQLYDPETNARAALALYERAGGWGPWGF